LNGWNLRASLVEKRLAFEIALDRPGQVEVAPAGVPEVGAEARVLDLI